MNELSLLLLNLICAECKTTTYKVFEIKELSRLILENRECDESLILDALSYLFEKDFIIVKYQDDTEICLSPTQKGRTFIEKKDEENCITHQKERKVLFSAMLGGFFGSFLVSVIALIMLLVLK